MTVKERAAAALEAASAQVLGLARALHADPETAWQEHRSAARVATVLEGLGAEVTPAYGGLATALRADLGAGGLNAGLIAEYDALPGLGHACGHNLIAAASVGAAAALAPLVEELDLTVSVLGTPAEEGGGGKVLLLERDGFAGLHAAMMVHPGPVDVARAEPYAVTHSAVAYQGRSAHAAAYPELGVNAADAFTVAQIAIGLLRQQLPDSVRVHGIVTAAGTAPNAIPSSAEGRWYVRASSLEELATIEPRIHACFEAGAIASGASLSITTESPPYAEFTTDEGMLARYVANAVSLGRRFEEGTPASRMNRASTDMGNVSRVLPAIHPYIGLGCYPTVNHQPGFADHCAGEAADRAVLDGALALAWTVIDLATDEDERVRLCG